MWYTLRIDRKVSHHAGVGLRLAGDTVGIHAGHLLLLRRSGRGAHCDLRDGTRREVVGRPVLPLQIAKLHAELEEAAEFIFGGGRHVRPGQ
jgi:hypothetical protein